MRSLISALCAFVISPIGGYQDVAEFFRLDDTVQGIDALYNVFVISRGDLVNLRGSICAAGVTGNGSLHR